MRTASETAPATKTERDLESTLTDDQRRRREDRRQERGTGLLTAQAQRGRAMRLARRLDRALLRLAGTIMRARYWPVAGAGYLREDALACRHYAFQARLVVSMLRGEYIEGLDAFHARKAGWL
jgi:hypothetical protein